MKTTIITLVFALFSTFAYAQKLTGRDIALMVYNRDDGDTRYSEMTMTLVNKNGSKRERKLKSYAKDYGKDSKKIMFFLYPGDVKGTGFLTWDYDAINKEDDKWLYLPAMKKTRRISGKSSKTDYFMGSDFTYDDMGKRNVDEDTHKLLREENLDGHKCWVIESIPKKSDEVYSKKLTWVREDCLVSVKSDYYDKLNKLQREFVSTNIKKIDGFWTTENMYMVNVQTNHKTLLNFYNFKYDIPVSDNLFTVSKLEKGL